MSAKTTDIRALATGAALTITVERVAQWLPEENRLRMVTALRVYETPPVASRARPRLLLGPVSTTDDADASYGDVMRGLASIFDAADEAAGTAPRVDDV